MNTATEQTVAAHLAIDLIRARSHFETRGAMVDALEQARAQNASQVQGPIVTGNTIGTLCRILDHAAQAHPDIARIIDDIANSIACSIPPRPDWMPDPHPLDVSELDRG